VIIATSTHWTAAPALPAALAEDQRQGWRGAQVT